MNSEEIKKYLDNFEGRRERTIVIVDFGNVEKWKNSLGWIVGIKELGKLVRRFSLGKKFLRRFYYGADYGKNENSQTISFWSKGIMEMAELSSFEVVAKRVKYIHSQNNITGFEKKCDLDVEMTVDLIRERDNYDTMVVFSGDGDLMYAIKYLNENFKKKCIVFGARGHIGREVFDAKTERFLEDILFAEDFEYRLNKNRFKP